MISDLRLMEQSAASRTIAAMTVTSDALPQFDVLALQSVNDPAPLYRAWRAAGPLIKGGLGQWAATRHADVAALVRDRRLVHHMPREYNAFALGDGPSAEFRQNGLLNRDGHDHHRLRRLIAQAFTPALVNDLAPDIQAMVDGMVEPLLDGEVCDFVDLVAFGLPSAAICHLLGIGTYDPTLVRLHGAALFGADQAAADAAVTWFRAFIGAVLAERRPDPGGDLLQRLLAAEDDGDALTHAEIVDNAVLLFAGGFETTQHLLSSGCANLVEHSDQQRWLRAHPDAAATAVEEFLRFDPAVRRISFYVAEPVTIGERVLQTGRVLHLLVGCANRDERVFADPDRLDVTRDPNPHIAFGGGAHRCLGLHLARLEATVVFRTLASRVTLEPAGPVLRQAGSTCTYRSVPVRAIAG